MTVITEAERRIAFDQALANTRVEGHVPSPEFLAECEAVITGRLTHEQAVEAGIGRVLKEHGLTTDARADVSDVR
ncbi:antitoxin VbhA family protein [Ramlibacter sp.]|uniref:antitoxin VbhA family protein n=1 Tax=Ramlibacter sp. TaxID=1917967 RepID=UPI002BCC796E|nr:antitoxin VbhA family protein [Ramlibacter sp.]HWI83842.1 antitoxin VbhA family protein [Ramlibacter sp.]